MRRQRVLLDQRARCRVDQRQRRLHAGEVELGAAEIRMRLDAAIGNDQHAPVVGDRHVVRADAVGLELADAGKAVGRVIEADHAAVGVEVVLAGIEEPAIRREGAVAIEVAALGGGDDDRVRFCRAGSKIIA